ncbi:MAG: peptidoglycan-binding protein [Acutalibacteraceae bacterium]
MTEKETVIYELQQFLRNISRAFGEISLIIPDGIFSDSTETALKEFQKNESLPVTGKADFATWDRLREENKRAVFKGSEPNQVVYIKNEDLPLVLGMENNQVYTLKSMLKKAQSNFSNFLPAESNSIFDPITKENVIRWQKIAFLPPTGQVDKATWNSISDYHSQVP